MPHLVNIVFSFASDDTEYGFLVGDQAPLSQGGTGLSLTSAGRTENCVVEVRVGFLESGCLTEPIAVFPNSFVLRGNSTERRVLLTTGSPLTCCTNDE